MSATLSTRDLVAYALSELQALVLKAEAWAQQARQQGRQRSRAWDSEIEHLVDAAFALGALARVARLHGDAAAGDEIDAATMTTQHQLVDFGAAARAAAFGMDLPTARRRAA